MQKFIPNFLLLASCSLLLSALPARAADVVAHWTFDELVNDGHAFADVHGPYRALINDPSAAALDAGKDVPFGKAARLGPGGTGLLIPALPWIYDHSFTVAAWAKLEDANGRNYLLADWLRPHAYAFGFDNGKIIGYLRNENPDKKGSTDIISGKHVNIPITANVWHHVAWVWNRTGAKSGTLTIYLDGVRGVSVNATGKVPTLIAENHRQASIGYKADTMSTFHGSVDELWIFNDALTADEVSNLMRSNDIHNSTQLTSAGPAAAPPSNSTPATPTTPTTPTTPGATDSSLNASVPAPAAPSNPTTPGTPAESAPSGASSSTPSGPPTFSVSSTTPKAPSPSSPPTSPAAPTPPTTPAPAFTVSHGTEPVAPITPAGIREVPAPHYTPARIVGMIASGTIALSLSAFLLWAAQERSKMRHPPR